MTAVDAPRIDQATLDRAQALVEAIADYAEQDRQRYGQAFAEGYRAGFTAGRDVGYGAAEHDMEQAWKPVAQRVRASARLPKHAELEARRWELRGEPRTRDTFGLPHSADGAVGGGGSRG